MSKLTQLSIPWKNAFCFLDYAALQEDAAVAYQASDMVLAIHSDASYLSKPKA
jgi:hypothetical protein